MIYEYIKSTGISSDPYGIPLVTPLHYEKGTLIFVLFTVDFNQCKNLSSYTMAAQVLLGACPGFS